MTEQCSSASWRFGGQVLGAQHGFLSQRTVYACMDGVTVELSRDTSEDTDEKDSADRDLLEETSEPEADTRRIKLLQSCVLYGRQDGVVRLAVSGTKLSRNIEAIVRCKYGVKMITFPKTIRRVQSRAFNMNPLKAVVLNEGLETIQACAFANTSLTNISFPATLRKIGDAAFRDCRSLKRVEFQAGSRLEAIGYGCFCRCDFGEMMLPGTLKSLGGSAFQDCSNLKVIWVEERCRLSVRRLTDSRVAVVARDVMVGGCPLGELRVSQSVVIPAGVEEIGDDWFKNSVIKSVTVSANVRRLGKGAFQNCGQLRRVVFSDGSALESVGDECFRECGLDAIAIPPGVTEIGAYAFCECGRLMEVQFSSDSRLTSIGEGCFSCSKLEKIIFPPTVRRIGGSAFYMCTRLREVRLNEGLEVLGGGEEDEIFASSAVESITFPSTLREIGAYEFCNCQHLKDVAFPDGLRKICRSAFSCSGLTSVSFPPSLEEIQDGAFFNCPLRDVVFRGTSRLKVIGRCAFGRDDGAMHDRVVFPEGARVSEEVFACQ